MNEFSFADRYAEAGIAPGAEIIAAREAPAKRIQDDITPGKIFDLVGIYLDFPNLNLEWFRDEFNKDDASFSLINNQRESRVLAAAILGALLNQKNDIATLSILCGSMAEKRKASEASWLHIMAKTALNELAVARRTSRDVETTINSAQLAHMTEEIAALAANDWVALVTTLGKMRTEAHDAATAIARQSSASLTALGRRLDLMNEEAQMLWWLFGEHSRSLNCHFGAYRPRQLAIIAGNDLGNLTTVSRLGPIAAPAMLERVLRLAQKERVPQKSLASAIDGLTATDLQALTTYGDDRPTRIFPLMTALSKAKENGTGSWHGAFKNATGFDANIELEPLQLATQIYYEHLLGQLL